MAINNRHSTIGNPLAAHKLINSSTAFLIWEKGLDICPAIITLLAQILKAGVFTMQLRPLITTVVLLGAIIGCYGAEVISHWPYSPPPPPAPPSGAPVIIPGPFTTDQYTPVLIQFPPTNTVGDPVTYTASARGGTVEVDGLDMTYTPNTNQYFLGGAISFTALDTVSNLPFSGSIFINFIYIPGPPIVAFTISPLTNFPGVTNQVIICASDGQPARIFFDDWGTVTRFEETPYVQWYEGTNLIGGNGEYGWVSEYPGVHTITLWATDFTYTNSLSETFEVITASTAATDLENLINESGVVEKDSRPFKRILFKAANWAAIGQPRRAYIELSDFERILRARNNPLEPALTAELENAAQQIMDTLTW